MNHRRHHGQARRHHGHSDVSPGAGASTGAASITVRTMRLGALGEIELPARARLRFAEGLPGFEAEHDFALIEDADFAPFGWLQSLGDPNVRFLVIDPALVRPGYAIDLADGDVASLALSGPHEARLLAIVTVPDDVEAMTANLKAPVVVNTRLAQARQVILTDDRFLLQHPVFARDEPAPAPEPMARTATATAPSGVGRC